MEGCKQSLQIWGNLACVMSIQTLPIEGLLNGLADVLEPPLHHARGGQPTRDQLPSLPRRMCYVGKGPGQTGPSRADLASQCSQLILRATYFVRFLGHVIAPPHRGFATPERGVTHAESPLAY